MLNLLWSALNVLVLLGIVYILFRAAKLVRQHLGRGALLLFVLAVLVISRRSANPTGPVKNLLARASTHGLFSNAGANQTVDLGGSNRLFLRAEYDSSHNSLKPNGLYASISGFTLGHRWEPVMGTLQPHGTQLRYWAVLNHHWLLLGTPVLTSSGEEFEGLMNTQPAIGPTLEVNKKAHVANMLSGPF
ncbi:hypothetical protein [Hymenobacter convexus]|uniref:hypothetical protein n=1 Tax=Hymenobacter sp. CA1UV-4 TaxID=3063782 RepID=UPI00271291B1|nr:hypothetical protein [Hymenobacter sp. CA1UV-4]MDO7850026.1 hypothetical protein [Hymenobacter sp. CA1UV-4]